MGMVMKTNSSRIYIMGNNVGSISPNLVCHIPQIFHPLLFFSSRDFISLMVVVFFDTRLEWSCSRFLSIASMRINFFDSLANNVRRRFYLALESIVIPIRFHIAHCTRWLYSASLMGLSGTVSLFVSFPCVFVWLLFHHPHFVIHFGIRIFFRYVRTLRLRVEIFGQQVLFQNLHDAFFDKACRLKASWIPIYLYLAWNRFNDNLCDTFLDELSHLHHGSQSSCHLLLVCTVFVG